MSDEVQKLDETVTVEPTEALPEIATGEAAPPEEVVEGAPQDGEATADSEGADIVDEEPPIEAAQVQALPHPQKLALIETLLFSHGEPLSLDKLADVTCLTEDELAPLLEELKAQYKGDSHGVEVVCVAGQYQLRSKARFGPFVRALKATAPRRLSNAALETLSIVAYRQPIVRSDVERIRGVDAGPTLKTLLERGLIKMVGHQSTVGNPALYGTTDEFLKLFGLGSIAELPTLREVKELESEPGETATPEA